MSELAWSAVRKGKVELVFQPICHSVDRSAILYCECLARYIDENSRVISPAEFIRDLEKSGEIRLFDFHIFQRILALLGEHPDVTLGVNVSALSAIVDP